jgi:hypothetical protein
METAYRKTVQKAEETSEERTLRKAANFQEVEALMPSLGRRRDSKFLDNLTSYLGKRNPFSHPVNPKNHNVWLFDNTAYLNT